MTDTMQARAHCLCGAVGITATSLSSHVHACHCAMCRTWGAAPFFAVDAQQNVSFEGEQHITCYRSSEWAERGFCAQCGTHLFYRLIETQQTMLSAGLFKDIEADFTLAQQLFIEEKPAFYSFANKTTNLTGAELFAQFNGEQ